MCGPIHIKFISYFSVNTLLPHCKNQVVSFFVGIIKNTYIRSIGRKNNFLIINVVVHKVTTEL